MFRNLLRSGPSKVKALNVIPFDQPPPAFVPPGDPFYTDFRKMKASQISSIEVNKAFPELAALIDNLKTNPSDTSTATTPQITPLSSDYTW